MSRTMFNRGHALPRSKNRFSLPPDFRGYPAAAPPLNRWPTARLPAVQPAALPPTIRRPSVPHARKLPGSCPPVSRTSPGTGATIIPVTAADSPPTDRPRYRRKYRIAVGQFSQHLPGLCPPLIRTASAERSNNFNRAAGNAFRTSSHGAMTFSLCETKAPPAKP